jgi:membrane associated rhomboid family serine protease
MLRVILSVVFILCLSVRRVEGFVGTSGATSFIFKNDDTRIKQPIYANRRAITRSPSPAKPILSVTNTLLAANVGLFLAGKVVKNLDQRLMKIDFLVRRGQLYRLFTAMFVHGSIQHLLFNAYTIFQIGPQVISISTL